MGNYATQWCPVDIQHKPQVHLSKAKHVWREAIFLDADFAGRMEDGLAYIEE